LWPRQRYSLFVLELIDFEGKTLKEALFMEKEAEKETKKVGWLARMTSEKAIKDFFIPRNAIDVVFILLCFALAWYAFTYDIPNAKVPVICAMYWNEWTNEKFPGGMFNATQGVTKYVMDINNTSRMPLLNP
jgi:hypothetical protein